MFKVLRVNVTAVTGYRPTVPSWAGEARSRSNELSDSLLQLVENCTLQFANKTIVENY